MYAVLQWSLTLN